MSLLLPEFGHYALILALGFALLQCTLPLMAAYQKNPFWTHLARPLTYGQFLFVGMAFVVLLFAFYRNDFSVAYVAHHSNTHLPVIYRLCALWGAHEGSLLLWVFLLSAWSVAVALCSGHLNLNWVARMLAVLGFIHAGFLSFLLFTSSPFVRLLPQIPKEGLDLNPLLQDPGLIMHPPMLYMGYVGFSVVFAAAIATLISPKNQQVAWALWCRSWTIVAWCFLTLGIVLGSHWAYRELGWGGWWFWDPVENASFLPWLVGTALLHSLITTQKQETFQALSILLAIFSFSLCLLGTFLVRSGVLISVHAFASDPARGLFILIFLGTVVGIAFTLYATRIAKVTTRPRIFALLSRQSFMLWNNALLTAAMLCVLLGTLYPLLLDTLGMGKISVGAPYFNLVFPPFAICLLILMAAAPFTRWHTGTLRSVWDPIHLLLWLSISITASIMWTTAIYKVGFAIGMTVALWLFLATLKSLLSTMHFGKKITKLPPTRWGMHMAHIGVAICAIGIVGSVYGSQQAAIMLKPLAKAQVGRYSIEFLGVLPISGPNYQGVKAGVLLSKNAHFIQLLEPEVRTYLADKTTLSHVAIHVNLWRDLYVALGQPLAKGAWSFRIYDRFLVRWIWAGGLMMILGGLFAFLEKRALSHRAYSK